MNPQFHLAPFHTRREFLKNSSVGLGALRWRGEWPPGKPVVF